MRSFGTFVFLMLVLVPAAGAQDIAETTDTQTGPVPVPEPTEKALRYHRGNNVLWLVDLAWGLLVPGAILFTGLSAKIRDVAKRIGRKWFFVIGVYFVLFTIVTFVIGLPLAYYEDFVRQHEYGLSNQTFSKWLGDSVKGLVVGLVAGFLLLWVPYLLLDKSPRRWWLYTSLFAIPVMIFFLLVTPIWIDPLFNDFGPMNDRALEARILALAEKAGIQGGRVFEVDKSVDTEAVNAYVTGFMNTKRIVLWDTILAKLDADELLFVMGHEMGHYVLGHVAKYLVAFSVLILATLYAAHRLSVGIIARYKGRFGFDRLSDIASLPLIMILVGVLGFVVTPLTLGLSRHLEHEADTFGLEVTRDNRAAAMAFVKLQQENLGVPRPGILYRIWRASHPVLGDRIDYCNTYRPWETGEPLRFSDRFEHAP